MMQCCIILTVNLLTWRKCHLFFTEKQNHLFPRMTMTLNEMLADPLTSNMKQYLVVFQNEDIPQAYEIFRKTLKIVDMRNHII